MAAKGGGRVAPAEGDHLHVEGERPPGHLGADGPESDQSEGAALESTERARAPLLGWLGDPAPGQLLLEGEHRGEHELGDGRRRRRPANR